MLLVGCTAVASGVGIVARPSHKAAEVGRSFSFETTRPKSFGDWRERPVKDVQVVNPETQRLLDRLYSQTLARTYVNLQGCIMLSLAYGDDQRGGLTAHPPEVC
jgi:hypothetical protein